MAWLDSMEKMGFGKDGQVNTCERGKTKEWNWEIKSEMGGLSEGEYVAMCKHGVVF